MGVADSVGVIPAPPPTKEVIEWVLYKTKTPRLKLLFLSESGESFDTALIILVMRLFSAAIWRFIILACLFILAGFLLPSCAEKSENAAPDAESLLMQARRERDQAFKSNPGSPIPVRDRPRFKGLDYYPINPSLRFRVQLNRYPTPKRIRLVTNTGEIREGLRYGYFEFQVEGRDCTLQVYRLEDSDNPGRPYLFIPFRDATSGNETYGAGRYLDLQENTTGMYDLDFNRAYNPFCAYGEGFSCPIPPEENRLAVSIRAGEKKYPLAAEH